MSVLITETGFASDSFQHPFRPVGDMDAPDPSSVTALEIDGGFDVATLAPYLDRIDIIRITFPAFTDGRGFSQARQLRMLGFHGRLRAMGHLIADQFPMLLRAGFDEVEINNDLALRQPQAHWLAALGRPSPDYQRRLRQFAPFENRASAAR